MSARRVALAALRIWRKEKRRADTVLSEVPGRKALEISDRAFALDLFYGVLRNLTLLDFWISCLRDTRLDSDPRDVVRLGLYQLLLLQIPAHAAVYESVELAPARNRALINGILRAAVREQAELKNRADQQPLSVRTSHPGLLISRWDLEFGSAATASMCAWNNQPAKVYARINRLKSEISEFAGAYPNARLLPHRPGFVELSGIPTEALARGDCYIQDPSTAMACELVDPQPGEKILDACAAPGGKTGYLAELMQNRGLITACDRDLARVDLLRDNLARLGIGIASVVCHDWERTRTPREIADSGGFDRILIDAPCTNTGVMRRRVDVKWRLRAKDFVRMPERQLAIVRAVRPLLKPGGVLVYSTCSLEPEENERVVQQLLTEFPGSELLEKKYCWPFRDDFDGAFAAKLVFR